MLSLPKILAPVDFSERSPGAAHFAGAMACHFKSELTLLHVVEMPSYAWANLEFGGPLLSELPAQREAEARKALEAFLADRFRNMKVKRLVRSGDPAHEIVEYAHAENTGLIVLPTHGYGTFRRFILGSVAAKVLHDADCPVFTGVHMPDAPSLETLHFQHIVCAVDFGPQSGPALEWAFQFAGEFGATLTVVHITPVLQGHPGEYFDPDWRGCLAREATETVEKLQDSLGTKGEVFVDEGADVPKAVCSAARRLQADLMVIGRSTGDGLLGRLRTNAYGIIRQSSCPVVSI